MTKNSRYRGLAAIALQRLSDSDLRGLHSDLTEMHSSTFVELIRNIEDEIENSLPFVFDRSAETRFLPDLRKGFLEEIDQIRRKELRLTVHGFAEMLREVLSAELGQERDTIPMFDSRRGLQAWLRRLLSVFSEQEIYHAVMRLRSKGSITSDSDWKLR